MTGWIFSCIEDTGNSHRSLQLIAHIYSSWFSCSGLSNETDCWTPDSDSELRTLFMFWSKWKGMKSSVLMIQITNNNNLGRWMISPTQSWDTQFNDSKSSSCWLCLTNKIGDSPIRQMNSEPTFHWMIMDQGSTLKRHLLLSQKLVSALNLREGWTARAWQTDSIN